MVKASPSSVWGDSDAGRDWGQEEKGTTEDEMTGWHYQLDCPRLHGQVRILGPLIEVCRPAFSSSAPIPFRIPKRTG